jgi:hypothetical protein
MTKLKKHLNDNNKMYVFQAKEMKHSFKKHNPKPDELEFVATVIGKDLEDAFRLTNHIDQEWWRNPEVTAKRYDRRSTSSGDVVIKDDKAYVCQMMGWTESKELTDWWKNFGKNQV